jgi:anti-sigma B factor antagonist
MLVDYHFQDDVCILRLRGRFQTGLDVDYLRAKTDELKATGYRKVLADFSDVPYIDSTGIGFVVSLYTSFVNSSQGQFVIAAAPARVREILDLTKLSSIIPIFDNEQSALAALKHAFHA